MFYTMVHDNRLELWSSDIDQERRHLQAKDWDEIYRKMNDNYFVHFQSKEYHTMTKRIEINNRLDRLILTE